MTDKIEQNKNLQEKKLYKAKPTSKRSLRDNPEPISDTPTMRRLQETKPPSRPPTQSLSQLHTSIIAQPSISKVKKDAKAEREKEIRSEESNVQDESNEDTMLTDQEEDQEEEPKISNPSPVDTVQRSEGKPDKGKKPMATGKLAKKDPKPILEPPPNKDNKGKETKPKIQKRVKIINGNPNYNILEDLNNTSAQISFAQLLNVSPKVRADLVRNLKLEKEHNEENSIPAGLVHRGNIAISKCKMYDVPSKVYLDYGSGINLISKRFFNSLPVKPTPVGTSSCSIIQVLADKDTTPGLIYNLPLTIGSETFNTNFRLVEKDNLLFDIIISFETIIENYLFINPVTLELCKVNSSINSEELKRIFKETADKYKAWEVIETLEGLDRSDENTNDLPEEELAFLLLTKETKHGKRKKKPSKKAILEELSVKVCSNICHSPGMTAENIEPIKEGGDNNPLQEKFEIINSILSESTGTKVEIDEVRFLLHKYIDIVAVGTDDLKKTKLFPHSIPLKENSAPFKQRSYRLSKIKADILKMELTKLLNKGLIVPSHSSWSSPVVLTQKKNGKWRLCIDFRKLNELTIKDSYSIPYIEEILFSIGGNVGALSTIDLFSGYHQIPMNEEDIEKTSFTTMYGNYNFVVMPFGLTNAPATFQREMNRIFFPLIGKCLFVYLDDLVIFSPNLEQHLSDLEKVFIIIKENGLKINIEKCKFLRDEVEVLGHILTTKGLKPVMQKVEVIKQWIAPTDISNLRSFLGTVGYYRKFIPNFAKRAHCLYNLLKKDVPFSWTKAHQDSFEDLRDSLLTYPILRFPDFKKPFLIRTDASYEGLGGVLLQCYDKSEFPIHFVSRSLRKEEKNYSITKLEGASAYYSVMKFKPFITGNEFETILITDHKPLVGLFTNKQPMDHDKQLTNWILTFSMLKVTVKYEEGRKNFIADALSRIPVSENNGNQTKDIKDDRETGMLIMNVSASPYMDNYITSKIVEIDGVKYLQDNDQLRKVVSDTKQKIELINKAHSIGHEGSFKTYHRLIRDFYWPNMKRDVKLFVKTCHRCQIFRPQPFPKDPENIPTPPEAPFVRVGLDLIGPLDVTRQNNQYIVVLVDYFTKWVEAKPLQRIESKDIIQFLTDVFSRHGIPEILVTDNGPQFISKETKGFLDLYNVFIMPATTYHPATNGEVENRNKELGKYLRLLSEREKEWDDLLPSALWALRTTKSEATGFSSFELLYGRRDKQPFELLVNIDKREPDEPYQDYVLRKFLKHRKWIQEAVDNIEHANQLWRDRRNQVKRMKHEYKAGDLVMVRYINRRKLDPYFIGPLRVVKVEFNTVTLCDPRTGELMDRNVHKKNIVPYFV